jgi:hypothetical protein
LDAVPFDEDVERRVDLVRGIYNSTALYEELHVFSNDK